MLGLQLMRGGVLQAARPPSQKLIRRWRGWATERVVSIINGGQIASHVRCGTRKDSLGSVCEGDMTATEGEHCAWQATDAAAQLDNNVCVSGRHGFPERGVN